MSAQESRKSRSTTRIAAALLVAAYLIAILAVAVFVRPLGGAPLTAIALLPAIVCFLSGIPIVARSTPRGILAVFHLVLYPLFATAVLGLPGALIAFQLSQILAV